MTTQYQQLDLCSDRMVILDGPATDDVVGRWSEWAGRHGASFSWLMHGVPGDGPPRLNSLRAAIDSGITRMSSRIVQVNSRRVVREDAPWPFDDVAEGVCVAAPPRIHRTGDIVALGRIARSVARQTGHYKAPKTPPGGYVDSSVLLYTRTIVERWKVFVGVIDSILLSGHRYGLTGEENPADLADALLTGFVHGLRTRWSKSSVFFVGRHTSGTLPLTYGHPIDGHFPVLLSDTRSGTDSGTPPVERGAPPVD